MSPNTPPSLNDASSPNALRLRPLIGTATGLLIGAGVAIGSGIFRNPGLVADKIASPIWIIAAWLFGGLFFTLAGLMLAELATRYPQAGGEYVYLRHAYGRFAAFFFGWGFTVFVIGGGVAVIAVALGDFTCELLGLSQFNWLPGAIGASAIVLIAGINLCGLRAGAATQNTLTTLKIAALLGIIALGVWLGGPVDWFPAAPQVVDAPQPAEGGKGPFTLLVLFAAALMPVMWCYTGTTDASKMSEEIRDPQRAMPRVLIGANLLVMTVYVLLNWAFLRVLTPAEMAAQHMVPAELFRRSIGDWGGRLALLLAIGIVLGGISSAILANVRVPFALARDGMAFRFMASLSAGQTPVGALLLSAGFAVFFAATGTYEDVLSLYTIATGVLFGLVNLSLFVIRFRERRQPPRPVTYFRCPAGMAVSLFLATVQFAIAVGIAWQDITGPARGALTLKTLAVFAVVSVMYLFWPKPNNEKAALS